MRLFKSLRTQKEKTEELKRSLEGDRELRHSLKSRLAALQLEAEVMARRKHR